RTTKRREENKGLLSCGGGDRQAGQQVARWDRRESDIEMGEAIVCGHSNELLNESHIPPGELLESSRVAAGMFRAQDSGPDRRPNIKRLEIFRVGKTRARLLRASAGSWRSKGG
ncbi:hypothetical protein TSAR_005330, partial [Trichomalopsis sarcophagae]